MNTQAINQRILRDAFRSMDAHRAQEIREAFAVARGRTGNC